MYGAEIWKGHKDDVGGKMYVSVHMAHGVGMTEIGS